MPNLVIIEDGTVLRMINDAQLAADIPCLYGKKDVFKKASGAGGGCSACAKRRDSHLRTNFNQIKTCLSGLSAEKRQVIKNWLGSENVRVMYTNTAGQVVQVNF